MNLEIKDDNEEIWDKIKELIEKYEYYNQIAICSFNPKYYEKVDDYNNKFNRTIVFGFLKLEPFFIDYTKTNHQISLNFANIIKYPQVIKDAHLH